MNEELARLVAATGLTRSEFSRRLGVAPPRISNWLNGKVPISAPWKARIRSLAESIEFVEEARTGVSVPVILGGGADAANAERALAASDGLIIGRFLRGGSLANPVSPALVRAVVAAARGRAEDMSDLRLP